MKLQDWRLLDIFTCNLIKICLFKYNQVLNAQQLN
jgi:hypothetical protein